MPVSPGWAKLSETSLFSDRIDPAWVALTRNMQELHDQSKLNTRGWTYQEAHFSPRLLTFTPEKVLLSCATHTRYEFKRYGEIYSSNSDRGYVLGQRRALLHLSNHIELYSQKDLTDQSDALKVITGLFGPFSHRQGDSVQ